MRRWPLILACVAATVAWTAQAQTDSDDARTHFEAELVRQCPDKQLELLTASQLRDGLDNYMDGLPQDVRDRLQKSETDHCSSDGAGASCVNLADITAAEAEGRMEDLVGYVCGSFLRCHSQGVCDYAR